jgi:hypothetical protein
MLHIVAFEHENGFSSTFYYSILSSSSALLKSNIPRAQKSRSSLKLYSKIFQSTFFVGK